MLTRVALKRKANTSKLLRKTSSAALTTDPKCCYCGFSTTYEGEFPGDFEHDCDPVLYPPIVTRQGLLVGRRP